MTRRAWLVDAGIAALGVLLAVLSLVVTREVLRNEGEPLANRLAVDITFVLVVPGLLILRRRFPLSTAAAVVALVVVAAELEVAEPSVIPIAGLLAMATAATHGHGRRRVVVLSACVAAVVAAVTHNLVWTDAPEEYHGVVMAAAVFAVLVNVTYILGAWFLGDTLRVRRQREVALLERTAELECQRESNAARAVLDERVRIARELHDVVAHHVSVMGVQAGAARRVLERRPELALEALTTIETSSRQTVAELHRILGILRTGSEVESLAPQPSLERLDTLISEVRIAGMEVEVGVRGDARPLPPGVDLSAYRIVQEALTNVRKHAGPASAKVLLSYRVDGVEVQVVDDGRGAAADRTVGPSNGLRGMQERVAMVGGRLEAGPRRSGGFTVRAWLPTGDVA